MSPEAKKPASRILEFALIFAVAYLASQLISGYFFPKESTAVTGTRIHMQDATVRIGHAPIVVLQNSSDAPVTIPAHCPMPPFTVERVTGSQSTVLMTTETALPCVEISTIPAKGSVNVNLNPWKYSLFNEPGSYSLTLRPEGLTGTGHQLTTTFSLSAPNAAVRLFRGLVTKPLLFSLVFIADHLPGHSLGWAIILLTLIVKVILFLPTQHALEGQKKMQLLQPKLEELKGKYKNDPKKLQEEMARVWKEHGVNPFQSCLPMLIQFPVLIGLFFVIRDGSVLEVSREFLYPMHQHLTWAFSHQFFGFDLTQPSYYVFPPLLVVMQFLQMKLSFALAKRKKNAEPQRTKTDGEKSQDMQQKIMLYVLPIMIGYFALQFPTAVSLYWGVSTLFAIGQQIIVNREHLKV